MSSSQVSERRTGGQAVVAILRRHGVRYAFSVPGESYLEVLDALVDEPSIRLITARHEAAAANMAVAHARLTGRPGVALVSRGPGATHAAVGVHIASQDSLPMLLLVGQVPRAHLDRDAFQEVDYERLFGGMARAVIEPGHADQVPEVMARAFAACQGGRPGPVVVVLPEDLLAEECGTEDLGPRPRPEPAPDEADLARVLEMLDGADRPLMVVGGPGWEQVASGVLEKIAGAAELPVAAAFRSQDLLDNRSSAYVGALGFGGVPTLAERVRESDLLLAVGTRIDAMTAGHYRVIPAPAPGVPLIHVLPDPDELGRVFETTVAVQASPATFLQAVGDRLGAGGRRAGWRRRLRDEYLASMSSPAVDPVDLATILRHLSDRLPEDAVITNGAGNYSAFIQRYFQFKRPGTQLAPVTGAMGFGVPAAVAAKAIRPERTVVCLAGDGCFLMSAQELATAALHELPIVVIVVSNGSYGTIRSHQRRRFPGREIGTAIRNPDFVAFARSFGAQGERITSTAEFAPALERALAAGRTALIEIVVDPSVTVAG
ncbi:MAG TPA: thiamine pyrophosphate-dependent enzyme [Candidatus Dormibacteraeota bacterium]|jgi:acetolactate synthase-1/2/3 large subunit|nr:thiamine pyrophosphate-dependent enzyme [Candidatus Dormibacteraeota bacterium]